MLHTQINIFIMKNLFLKKALFLLMLSVFFSCEKSDQPYQDPCATTICYNDGVCVSGTCECPTGFTGANCQTQVAPLSIAITKIVVREFSNTPPTGGFWDNQGSGFSPDIDVRVFRQQNTSFIKVYESPSFYTDAVSPGEYTFELNTPITIYQTDNPHVISIYNYNGLDIPAGEDEEIGSVALYPYEPNQGFPPMRKITLGYATVDVYFSYTW